MKVRLRRTSPIIIGFAKLAHVLKKYSDLEGTQCVNIAKRVMYGVESAERIPGTEFTLRNVEALDDLRQECEALGVEVLVADGEWNKLVIRYQSPERVIYDTEDGIEVVVDGSEARRSLAHRVVEELAGITEGATKLLVSFMRESGTFNLELVEVFSTKSDEGGDFSLRFVFTGDRDPHEYNYTYFDVYFSHHEPPQPEFWPYKFTVGFH